MNTLLVFFTLISFYNSVHGYKILMVSLLASKSHHNLNVGITNTLAKAGHEVTLISPFNIETSKFRAIGIPELFEYVEKSDSFGFSASKMSPWELTSATINLQRKSAEFMFNNEGVLKLFENKTEKFDAIIYEYFSSDFLAGFGAKYDCPIILLSPINMMDSLAKMIGNPSSVAVVPNLFLDLPPKMNFLQRAINLMAHVIFDILDVFILCPSHEEMYFKYFPEESKIESFDDVKKRISFVFVNSHPSMGVPRPFLPNVVEIGGYHITDDPKPLDEDLKKIMDSAENGVIFFSLGSVTKGMNMKDDMKHALLKSFSKLKQTILWKFEDDMPEKPDNVIIRKWMPQNSILSHPNLKLFITHGGLLSSTEAVHFGVPLIIIPVFWDQPYNARMAFKNGQGLILNIDNITESSLDWTINEVLQNKKYADNARRLQDLYFDRPITPLNAISYYTEHVIRTKGAKHLSPPKLNRFSLLLLDVFALISAMAGVVIFIVYYCFRKVLCKKYTPKPVSKTAKNKKNN